MITELNEKNFDESIKTGLKLVEFYTPWCSYCQKQQPILEELTQNNIWIGAINADLHPELTSKFAITGFPTFVLFKNGGLIATITGFHEKSQLLSRLMENITK